MNWGLVVTNLVFAVILGIRTKGEPSEYSWWLTIVVFSITMQVRDYYLLKGGY